MTEQSLSQSKERIYERSRVGGALRQGEILTNLRQATLALETVGAERPRVKFENHPFAIVLSQDCDLSQAWSKAHAATDPASRPLPCVLFAQMQPLADLRSGIQSLAKTAIWERVMQNKEERYHFLQAVPPENDALDAGLPELGIDFKRYFTIPIDEVYKRLELDGEARRRCYLLSPYLEHLSTRFCYYQFRVALPMDHQSV